MQLSVVHNVLMIGPPGAGKTLPARAMPRMTIDEALDVTRIYSVADQLPADTLLIRTARSAPRLFIAANKSKKGY